MQNNKAVELNFPLVFPPSLCVSLSVLLLCLSVLAWVWSPSLTLLAPSSARHTQMPAISYQHTCLSSAHALAVYLLRLSNHSSPDCCFSLCGSYMFRPLENPSASNSLCFCLLTCVSLSSGSPLTCAPFCLLPSPHLKQPTPAPLRLSPFSPLTNPRTPVPPFPLSIIIHCGNKTLSYHHYLVLCFYTKSITIRKG